MDYQVISADSHIDLKFLPHDLFVSNAPSRWKEEVPRVIEAEDGETWAAGGKDLRQDMMFDVKFKFDPIIGQNFNFDLKHPPRGYSRHTDRMYEAGFYDGPHHPTTPELRLKDQAIDGVDAEVVYGILGLATTLKNPDLITVVYDIYNTWLADFCKTAPGGFAGLACIPNDDPENASRALERAAKLGLKGADFAVSTAGKPFWHRDWDRVWAAAAECQLPVSFHSSGFPVRQAPDAEMAQEYRPLVTGVRVTLFPMGAAEYLVGAVLTGILERHPNMKFVLGEAGVGWIPYLLVRMDEEYDARLTYLNLSAKPSEYWRRQGYTTYQEEPTVADAIPIVGENNIMWGSDYPHFDGVWPDSHKVIDRDLAGVDAGVRRKLTCENAGRLYGLL